MGNTQDDRLKGLRLLTGDNQGTVNDLWMKHMLTRLSLTDRGAVRERDYWATVGPVANRDTLSLADVKKRAIKARQGTITNAGGEGSLADYENRWWAAVAAGTLTP